jgi:hypothetical protein
MNFLSSILSLRTENLAVKFYRKAREENPRKVCQDNDHFNYVRCLCES